MRRPVAILERQVGIWLGVFVAHDEADRRAQSAAFEQSREDLDAIALSTLSDQGRLPGSATVMGRCRNRPSERDMMTPWGGMVPFKSETNTV